MRILKVDEFLIVNMVTHKKRWCSRLPSRLGAYDVAVRVRGTVKIPDSLPIIDFGEISIPEFEAEAQAQMG